MTNLPKPPEPAPGLTPGPTIACRIPGLPQRPPAFAPNPYLGPHWQEPEPDEGETVEAEADTPIDPVIDLAAKLGRSLQLSRAGALGLTRLQLAIKCGDRHAAMAAMDRLHAVDADMERLVERLPQPGEHSPAHAEWQAIARHLADQKLSLAFEKLAMVSAISGPDMVSAPPRRAPQPTGTPAHATGESNIYRIAAADSRPPESRYDEPPLSDWPRLPAVQPTEWTAIPAWLIGLLMAVLAMVAIGAALVTMAG